VRLLPAAEAEEKKTGKSTNITISTDKREEGESQRAVWVLLGGEREHGACQSISIRSLDGEPKREIQFWVRRG